MNKSRPQNKPTAPVMTLFEIKDNNLKLESNKQQASNTKGFLLQTRQCFESTQSQDLKTSRNYVFTSRRSQVSKDRKKEAVTLSKENETKIWRMLQSATYGKPMMANAPPQTARLDSTQDEKISVFNESSLLNQLKSARLLTT